MIMKTLFRNLNLVRTCFGTFPSPNIVLLSFETWSKLGRISGRYEFGGALAG